MTSKTIKHPLDLLLAFSFSASFKGSHLSGCFVLDFLSRVSFHNFAPPKKRKVSMVWKALHGFESVSAFGLIRCIFCALATS